MSSRDSLEPPLRSSEHRALRSDLDVGEPTDAGKVRISDERNNRHYLVSTTTITVLRYFDGTRTDHEVLEQLHADGLPVSERGLEALIAKATSMGLYAGSEPEAELATHLRGPSRRNLMFWKVFEVDPTGAVEALRPLGRLLFSRIALVCLVALLIVSGWVLAQQSDRYVADTVSFANIAAWLMVYVGNVVVTLMHEFGHALAVGHYGGSVRRMGLAVYLLSPAAYTDTSSAYSFPRARQRAVVSLAGVYVELFVFAACVFVWAGDWVSGSVGAAIYLMGHVILARVVLNLNPLLRLDGYWLVSDLLEISNMRAKAFTVLLATISPFRVDRRRVTFVSSAEERLVLLFYAVIALGAVVLGLLLGFTVLDGIARRYLEWYGDTASQVAMVVIAAVSLFSGWVYLRSLRKATFVRGKDHAG